MMKICLFADGTSIHTVRWCNHFHELGHEVHLISFKKVEIPNIHIYTVNGGAMNVDGGNWKVLLTYPKIKKILKQISPDVFHSLYATSYGITGALCGFHPYIITALGTDVLISPNQSKIYKVLLRYAFSKADWITAMADHMKIAIEKMGVSPSKVTTVSFGIDPKVFNYTDQKLSKDPFVITSTRNFEKIYNIPHLINAVAIAKSKIPSIQLNLIGTGSLKKEIETLIDTKGLKENVTFFGKIPQSRIAEVLNHSHLFVTVSLSDGNNISLNEAMACGTYSIATNIPANTQWIVDGENGFLVEIDDVEELAEKIILSYKELDKLQERAIPINKKKIIIHDPAIESPPKLRTIKIRIGSFI
jgi:glycosyltransferase involved in cell wall biosynthesis